MQLSYISLALLIVRHFSHMFKNATFYPGWMANWQKTADLFIPAYSIPLPYPLIVMQNAGLHNPSLFKISTIKRDNKPLWSLQDFQFFCYNATYQKKKLRNTTWNILDNANAPDLHIYCGEARHSSGCELEFNFTWNLCQNTRLTIWYNADTSWIIEYLKFDQTWIYPVLFLTEWSRLFCWVVVLNLQAVRVYYVL